MKFFITTSYYPSYLRMFYGKNENIHLKNYSDQFKCLMNDCFGWSDFFDHEFRKLGYEVFQSVNNAEFLQKRWALEANIRYSEDNWSTDILFEQIKAFRPDVVWIHNWNDSFGPEFVKHIRSICPQIRLVMGHCGEAHPEAGYYRQHDILFSSSPDTVDFYKAHGAKVHHLNHAFSPLVLERVGKSGSEILKMHEAGFIGSLIYGDDFHNTRAFFLKELKEELDIKLFSEVSKVVFSWPVSPVKSKALKTYFNLLNVLKELKVPVSGFPKYENYEHYVNSEAFTFLGQCAEAPVFGLDMYRTLQSFKCFVNIHAESQYASNMKMFEVTGMGTCLVSDFKKNIKDLFEPDIEMVTFKTKQECVEKVRYLIDHEEERKKIETAGHKRVLKQHTFGLRASKINEIIQQAIRDK